MSRRIHMRRVLHLPECNLRGDSDLSIGDMHSRADMCRIGIDMFSESDMSILPVLRWYNNMPVTRNVHRIADLPRDWNLPRRADMRSAADVSNCAGVRKTDYGRCAVVSRFVDMPGIIYLLAVCDMRRRDDLLEPDMYLGADMHTEAIDVFVYTDLPAVSIL